MTNIASVIAMRGLLRRLSGRGEDVTASRARDLRTPPPEDSASGRGADPVGAPGRPVRRLSAALAAFLLLTLAAALAPQAAQAQVVLTATPGDGQVTLTWTYGGSGHNAWRYSQTGSATSVTNTIPSSNAAT